MNEISPTFDPSDNTWFTDDGTGHGYEAKSLAELQLLLPDVIIKDYYPKGYSNVIPPRPPHVTKIVDGRSKLRYKPEIDKALAEERIHIPSFLPIREEEVPLPEPTPDYAAPKRTRVRSLNPLINWKDEDNVRKLKGLVEQGFTGEEIGRVFQCSRNAIIGACHRKGFQLKGR